jgi:hypothetical protein
MGSPLGLDWHSIFVPSLGIAEVIARDNHVISRCS